MGRALIIGVILCLAAAGCMSTDARMLDDRTAAISSRGAPSRSGADVYQASLVEAAQQTQMRGFDLFQIQSVSQYAATEIEKPGVDLVIRMYRAGEIQPDAPGVFSAANVLQAAIKR